MASAAHAETIPLVQHRTDSGERRATCCLLQMLEAVVRRRPKTRSRGTLLHHDNVPAHRPHVAVHFSARKHIQEVGRPPYSPDLAPCDFFVFPKVKNLMRGIRCESPGAAVQAFAELAEGLPALRPPYCAKKHCCLFGILINK